jgi:gluconate kinase
MHTLIRHVERKCCTHDASLLGNAGTGIVISCSALQRDCRDTLRGEADNVQTIFLRGPSKLIAGRIANRGESHLSTKDAPDFYSARESRLSRVCCSTT